MKLGKQEVQTRSVLLFLYVVLVIGLTYSNGVNFLTYWLIGWVVVSHLVAEAAERKNRNYTSFLFLSILVSPLLMGIIVAVMANPEKK
jgi:hypothetical protein